MKRERERERAHIMWNILGPFSLSLSVQLRDIITSTATTSF